jgi:hypothetical protein
MKEKGLRGGGAGYWTRESTSLDLTEGYGYSRRGTVRLGTDRG